MSKKETVQSNAPTHIAYQVKEGKLGSYWTRIGVAFAHKDANGFSIQLDSLPIDGKVTLRAVSDKQPEHS